MQPGRFRGLEGRKSCTLVRGFLRASASCGDVFITGTTSRPPLFIYSLFVGTRTPPARPFRRYAEPPSSPISRFSRARVVGSLEKQRPLFPDAVSAKGGHLISRQRPIGIFAGG